MCISTIVMQTHGSFFIATCTDSKLSPCAGALDDLLPSTYDPVRLRLMAQDFAYPSSNGLTQSDRDYFRAVRAENGMSDFVVISSTLLRGVNDDDKGGKEGDLVGPRDEEEAVLQVGDD